MILHRKGLKQALNNRKAETSLFSAHVHPPKDSFIHIATHTHIHTHTAFHSADLDDATHRCALCFNRIKNLICLDRGTLIEIGPGPQATIDQLQYNSVTQINDTAQTQSYIQAHKMSFQ